MKTKQTKRDEAKERSLHYTWGASKAYRLGKRSPEEWATRNKLIY